MKVPTKPMITDMDCSGEPSSKRQEKPIQPQKNHRTETNIITIPTPSLSIFHPFYLFFFD